MSQIDLQKCGAFVEQLQAANTRSELTNVCHDIVDAFGFSYFLYGAYLPHSEEIVVLDGFPQDWRIYYEENNCIEIDPTVKHCWSSNVPIAWENLVFSKGRRGVEEREFMRKASTYGLHSGISIPIHGAGAEGGMLSLVDKRAGRTFDRKELDASVYLTHSAHEELKRVLGVHPSDTGKYELTNRELECLRWTANGKTSWEISVILNISENTVIFHLKNAIQKMQATNRSQAVAKAITLSQIVPF